MTNSILLSQISSLPPLAKRSIANRLTKQRTQNKIDLLIWTILHRRVLSPDRLFSLQDHLFLVDIYMETARRVVAKKSSQIGLSEFLISFALHACDQRQATVLYVFPTDTHVSDFSSARLGPALESSEYLEAIVADGKTTGKRGADRVTLKRVRNRFLYFRGGRVTPTGMAPQLKSIDADVVIFDEVDELDQRAIPIGRKRLGHSQIAEERTVSTPSYAGMGIDAEWQESDQREWFIPCPHCGKWQYLTINHIVTTWDELERPVTWHGQPDRAFAACEKCGKELNRLAQGRWVARYPGREVVGYHPTKFASPVADLLQIVKALDTTDETKRREAVNQDLGEVYTPRGGQMTDAILDKCRREYAHCPMPGERVFMGADVGKVLHVVIRAEPDPESGEWPQRWAGEVDSFEELGRLMKRFDVEVLVIDALPETRKCRDLQADFPDGVVWLAYYGGGDEGTKIIEPVSWDEKNGVVNIDRTRSLDEMYSRFYDRKNTLPANARDIRDYYDHLKAPVRVLEEKRGGQKIARYVEGNKPDHLAHAENYCMVAMKANSKRGSASSSVVTVEELGFG